MCDLLPDAKDAKKIALAAGAFVALVLAELARRKRSTPRGVYILPGHWLLGQLPDIVRAAAKRQHLEWGFQQHQAFGKTLALRMPFGSWNIRTTCPKNVEHVLKTNFGNYPKGSFFQDRLFELLGGGIFNADGEEWHRQRKVSSKMFTANLFREHIWVVMRRNARKLRDILEASDPDKPIDVFNLMNRFTLDSIGEIGFGKCIGSLEDPTSPFLASFDKAQHISFWRFQQPLWKMLRFLAVGTEQDTREHFSRLDAYSRTVVRELYDAMEHGTSKNTGVGWADIEARKSFLGLFLEDAKNRGVVLTEDYLRDLVLNFLIAGRDTTAQALSWIVFCLSQHPEVEAATRQEIIDVCGVRGPAYEDLPLLPYLNAVVSEALRLYPSVPVDVKVALQDDTLPDGTFVPRGCRVVYDIYSMGRDSSIWGDDAQEFRPERWLEMTQPVSNYEYPVFNGGPRECLGRRLAMVEMKTCLAMLLPQMSFELAVPEDQITPDTQLTIGMGRGLPCFVRKAIGRKRLSSKSDCETLLSETTAASSKEGKTLEEQFDAVSECDSCSESARESNPASSRSSSRQRSKKRKSGWSRQRRAKFWQTVRANTPERWPTM